jgi:two-component system, chemotaxis family, chemotaxis protein CheY
MKILMIDDSPLSRGIVRRALGQNCEFIEANDGLRGMELYAQEKPDLVILDLIMPGIDGIEILRRLRDLDPQARIVIGTADVQEYTRQEAYSLGAVGYLTKPYTEGNVNSAVELAFKSQDKS